MGYFPVKSAVSRPTCKSGETKWRRILTKSVSDGWSPETLHGATIHDLALQEGTCDETLFEGLCFPLSIRNWHFVTKMVPKSFLWSSEYGKTAGSCRQRKFSFRPLSLSKNFRSNVIEEMGFYRTFPPVRPRTASFFIAPSDVYYT
jgi:hypothetical protein